MNMGKIIETTRIVVFCIPGLIFFMLMLTFLNLAFGRKGTWEFIQGLAGQEPGVPDAQYLTEEDT